MDKDEALKLALEALQDADRLLEDEGYGHAFQQDAITALQSIISQDALDKMADNYMERLDYEPCCKDQTCPKCKPAPVQPVDGTQVSKVWWDGEKLMAKPIPLEDIYQPVQEPWSPNDTAHRPGGLPQDFTKHEVDLADAWSEWVCPASAQYLMKCCDCGLVHEMQFKVAKYSEGDECEFVADADLQAVFRARRTTPPAAPVQEPVLKDNSNYRLDPPGLDPADGTQVSKVWWDGERLMVKPIPLEDIYQPVQEPVAWMHKETGLLRQANKAKGGDFEPNHWTPLYTTPPAAQRQWVGLTDEEIEKLRESFATRYAIEAIEAKLKEKNT